MAAVAAGNPVRVVSYNVLDGGTGRADPLAEVVLARRPDVVVLVEATDRDVVDRLAWRFKMDALLAEGAGDAVAVLSRWPVLRAVNHALVTPGAPRGALAVEFGVPGGGRLGVMGVHLSPRATIEQEQRRVAEVGVLLEIARGWRQAAGGPVPHVIAGDFNANSPHQIIDLSACKQSTRESALRQGGEIPRDAIETLERAGYVDTLYAFDRELSRRETTFTTHEPGQRVDYVFGWGVAVREAWVERDRLATYASDHYPVGAEVDVAGG